MQLPLKTTRKSAGEENDNERGKCEREQGRKRGNEEILMFFFNLER